MKGRRGEGETVENLTGTDLRRACQSWIEDGEGETDSEGCGNDKP